MTILKYMYVQWRSGRACVDYAASAIPALLSFDTVIGLDYGLFYPD